MKLQLLRNATQLLKVNGKTILIDPMLAPKASYDPIQKTDNDRRNPLVDLPLNETELKQLIAGIDAVLLTHLHNDHWDATAREMLPKSITLFCQPVNEQSIRQAGFTNVIPVDKEVLWNDIRITRTGGQHGTGDIGKLMGVVSGYVISYEHEILYIAGDTIWCDEVKQALDKFQPNHIVLNGGAAQFKIGDPVIMNINDVLAVCNYAPEAKIYVVHLEAVNHIKESRADIRAAIHTHQLTARCYVPDDGEWFLA